MRTRMSLISLFLVLTGIFGNPDYAHAATPPEQATPRAFVDDGKCDGAWQLRGDPWYEDLRNVIPSLIGGLWVDVYHLRAIAVYAYCPDTDGPTKIRWNSTRYRVADVDHHYSFAALEFETWMTEIETGDAVIPGPFKVWDDGTDSTLYGTDTVPVDHRKWMRMDQLPAWSSIATARNSGWPDTGAWFTAADGSNWNRIRPGDSSTLILSGWHY